MTPFESLPYHVCGVWFSKCDTDLLVHLQKQAKENQISLSKQIISRLYLSKKGRKGKPLEFKNLPADMDKECIKLCQAMNQVKGIHTIDSCCGHGKTPYWIFFKAEKLEDLPPLLYWFSACHSGVHGWQIVASTDCGMSPVTFCTECKAVGTQAYEESYKIAEAIVTGILKGEVPGK